MRESVLRGCSLRLAPAVCVVACLGAASAAAGSVDRPYNGHLDWVAGGRLIAYASRDRTWTVRGDGGGRTIVGQAFGARLSPSGRLIGYAGDTGTSGVLAIAPAGGKVVRRFRLWAGQEAQGYAPPVWSPDERRVIVEIATARSLFYRVDLAGKPHRISASGSRDDWSPAWSPDGRRLAFLSCYGYRGWSCDLAVMRPDGRARRTLVRRIGTPDVPSGPVWSPDGTMLAYTAMFGPERETGRRSLGRTVGVYIVRADGSRLRRVAQTRLVETDIGSPSPPAWSPDGGRIAFADGRRISVVELGKRKAAAPDVERRRFRGRLVRLGSRTARRLRPRRVAGSRLGGRLTVLAGG